MHSLQSLAITSVSFLVSALGFVNHLILARVFGIGSHIDEFLYATSAPLFVAGLLISFFMYGAVPILMRADNPGRSTSTLFIAACLLACPFFILSVFLGFNSISSLGAIGSNKQLVSVAWAIGGVQVIFGGLSAIFNAKRYFLTPILLLTLTPSGFAIGAVLTIESPNIVLPLIGMLAGVIASSVLSIIVLRSFLTSIRQTSLNDLMWLLRGNTGLFGTLLASNAFAAYAIIDAYWAPHFGVGSLSTLGYAQRIVIGFGNIAVIGVFSTSGPKFSDSLQKCGFNEFRLTVRNSIMTVASLALILAFLLWYSSDLLIIFIFGETVHPGQVLPLRSILPLMLVGMIPMLCSTVLLRAVLCLKDSHLYTLLFGAGVPIAYFTFCWVLSPLGLLSFGFAYLISWIFGFSVLATPIFFRPPRIVKY